MSRVRALSALLPLALLLSGCTAAGGTDVDTVPDDTLPLPADTVPADGKDTTPGPDTDFTTETPTVPADQTQTEETAMPTYQQITQEEAHRLMNECPGCVILDVREQDEFDAGHIPGAILMPYTQAEALAPDLLPDKSALILVYCRSGRRSKIAAQTLADMGYTDIREFGGIIDWPYEVIE